MLQSTIIPAKLFVVGWGLMAFSAQIGYIVPQNCLWLMLIIISSIQLYFKLLPTSVILVNENENENYQKRKKNDDCINEN